MSPSIDILIPSNIERLLFLLTNNPSKVKNLMKELKENKKFSIDKELLEGIRKDFIVDFCSEEECLETINKVYKEYNYITDPHTSVALKVLLSITNNTIKKITSEEREEFNKAKVTILSSTAHFFKFSEAVLNGLKIEIKKYNKEGADDNEKRAIFKDNLQTLYNFVEESNKNHDEENYIHSDFVNSLNSKVIHTDIADNNVGEVQSFIEKFIQEKMC